MRAAAFVIGLAAFIEAHPLPQSIDYAAVKAAGPPPTASVPMGVGAVPPTVVPYNHSSVYSDTASLLVPILSLLSVGWNDGTLVCHNPQEVVQFHL
jgi:hypothetical protein